MWCREKCLKAGMDAYLSKPIDMKALKQTLENYLSTQEPHSVEADKEEQEGGDSHDNQQTTAPSDSQAIDPSVLKELFGDDDETYQEILFEFRDTSANIVQEIVDAYSKNDHVLVQQSSHKLKSAARSVGAGVLADLSYILENAGKNNQLSDVETQVADIKEEFAKVKQYIDSLS